MPSAIATDPVSGNLIISDAVNALVLVNDADGNPKRLVSLGKIFKKRKALHLTSRENSNNQMKGKSKNTILCNWILNPNCKPVYGRKLIYNNEKTGK